MANITVVHYDMMTKGGGEAVSMNLIEGLQRDHDITLYTSNEADLGDLNEFYNTDVGEIQQKVIRKDKLFPDSRKLGLLSYAIFGRLVRRSLSDPDLVINTEAELYFPYRTIHYVHYPRFLQKMSNGWPELEVVINSAFRGACRRISGFSLEAISDDIILTNSEWTANRIHESFNRCSTVVYPPVDTNDFVDVPWEEREPGFITIGRIHPQKNVLRNIDIISKIRKKGHDVHLHIVGAPNESDYFNQVLKRCDESEFVKYEGELTRSELVSLICNHRYGLHGREDEHFGMAVAEFVAGGAIPFVPDSGGQTEIVGENEHLTYRTSADAIERIDEVLSSPSLRLGLREELKPLQHLYTSTRFKDRIRTIVSEAL